MNKSPQMKSQNLYRDFNTITRRAGDEIRVNLDQHRLQGQFKFKGKKNAHTISKHHIPQRQIWKDILQDKTFSHGGSFQGQIAKRY